MSDENENNGWSSVAKKAEKIWEKPSTRPAGWVGSVYGVVIHTTGSGAPSKAKSLEMDPLKWCVNHYFKNKGTHYVIDWNGKALQLANEKFSANGVGVTEQKSGRKVVQKGQVESVDGKYSGSWETDLPKALVKRWKEKWSHTGATNPLELFPSKYANSCYVHIEMIPCVFHHKGKLINGAEPMAPGLRFTKAQHEKAVELVIDIANRNGLWETDTWWKTGRLVGHSDISPISRHDKNGGWDPGGLRATPRFDWSFIYDGVGDCYDEMIFSLLAKEPTPALINLMKPEPKQSFLDSLINFLKKLFKRG